MRVFKTMPIIAMLFVMVTRVSAQTEMNDSIMSGINHGVGSTDHFLR